MTDRELMQMALDALEEAQDYTSCPTYSPSMTQQCATAAVALRARLAQSEPEPVAWHEPGAYGNVTVYEKWANDNGWLPLYTAPPQREWQGLTDDELDEINGSPIHLEHSGLLNFARAIEAKLKEKNSD